MRMYQPVLSEKEWEEGNLPTFGVYHYLDNAKEDYPDHQIAVYEEGEIEEPTFMDVRRTRIRLFYDTDAMNPWEDWDCNLPLMHEGGRNSIAKDYSDGAIDGFLISRLKSLDQSAEDMIDGVTDRDYEDFKKWIDDDLTEDEEWDLAIDEVEEWLEESVENRGTLADYVGVTYYQSTSRGYSQSDWAEVFICWTPEFGEKCGPTEEEITEERLEGAFELFGQWAWGDVFYFTVEEEETGDLLDSCGGFYGRNFKENGIMEHIMNEVEDKTEEEVLDILYDIEIEVR